MKTLVVFPGFRPNYMGVMYHMGTINKSQVLYRPYQLSHAYHIYISGSYASISIPGCYVSHGYHMGTMNSSHVLLDLSHAYHMCITDTSVVHTSVQQGAT